MSNVNKNVFTLQDVINDPEGGYIEIQAINNIVIFLESEGFVLNKNGLGDNNGWQVDFWLYFTHPEKGKWCLSGSWYYGDYRLTKVQ
jgi:hypothetical protein